MADNLSRVFGSHTLKVGVELQHRRFFHITEVPPRGNFTFTGQYTGNPIADYLLGLPGTAGGAAGSSRSNYRSNFLGLLVQEDWRVNQRLTLNLGLRYEYGAPWKEQSNQEGLFDPATGLISYHKLPANIPPALNGLFNTKEGLVPAGVIQPDKNWLQGSRSRSRRRMCITPGLSSPNMRIASATASWKTRRQPAGST